MTCGIYKLINRRTGEVYVGHSGNIEKRVNEHLVDLENNLHLNKGLQKDYNNGDRFNWEIIEKTSCDLQTRQESEVIWIMRYDSFYHGYNRTPGGNYDQSKGSIGFGGGRLADKFRNYDEYSQNLNPNLTEKDYYNIGESLYSDNRFDEALIYYNKSLDLNNSNPFCLERKANCLLFIKRYSEAVNAIEKYIAVDPTNSSAWGAKAANLYHLKNYEEALSCINRSLELKRPDDSKEYSAKLWFIKGSILEELNYYEEALNSYNESLKIKKQDYVINYKRDCELKIEKEKKK